ncbi:nucleoside-diphosphate sugar epimerase, partial [Patescibacteria group bacterium]|nr:nucleoside-diphosphate sugar epimerase [Patescibacteria group bacterium]
MKTTKKESIVSEDIRTIAENIKKEAGAFEGKTVLISGGAGFLGSYLTAVFLHLNQHRFKKPCAI